MKFAALFKPIEIGNVTISNRLLVPAMGTNYSDAEGKVTQRMLDYYGEHAKGGYGLVTIEITAVDPAGRTGNLQPGLWHDGQIDGYGTLAEVIHSHGSKMSVQIHHAGRQSCGVDGNPPFAPSAIPCTFVKSIPQELSTGATYQLIDDFVNAAERAKKAGADVVEVHGAHGYLIAGFMSSATNKRVDEFGGSFENRIRFPKLIVEGIRGRLGKDFPIFFRISGEEKIVGGRTIAETRAIAKIMQTAGVSAMHVTAGTYGSMDWIWGASDSPAAYMAHYAEDVKKSIDIPVITAGRINDPYIADELIASGRVDMVAIGRQSIADHYFPEKVRMGELEKITPCIGCHQGCTSELFSGRPITCVVNPLASVVRSNIVRRTTTPKKIMVVGGGPGGLLSAGLLAERGHTVSLYEKNDALGGQYLNGSYPPGKTDLAKMIRHYHFMGKTFGVTYHMNTEVTAELVLEQKPDTVILATGGTPLHPKIPGIDNPFFIQANDVLTGKKTAGKKVLIVGGGMVGAETADYLGAYGSQVTIIEMRNEVAADVNFVIRLSLMRRLKEYGVVFLTDAVVKLLIDDGVVYKCNGEEIGLSGFDSIVLALGTKSYNPLEHEITGLVSDIRVIGDAVNARKVLDATREAAELGISL